jgi:hypothetical protein
VATEGARVLLDLRRELTRGREDQRARRALGALAQALEHRQHERRRLAAAGHRACENVAALERGRDRGALDGSGDLEAEVGDPAKQGRVKSKFRKRHDTAFQQSSA